MIWIISLTAYLTAVTVFCGFSAFLGDKENIIAAVVLNIIVVGASFLGYMAAI